MLPRNSLMGLFYWLILVELLGMPTIHGSMFPLPDGMVASDNASARGKIKGVETPPQTQKEK